MMRGTLLCAALLSLVAVLAPTAQAEMLEVRWTGDLVRADGGQVTEDGSLLFDVWTVSGIDRKIKTDQGGYTDELLLEVEILKVRSCFVETECVGP